MFEGVQVGVESIEFVTMGGPVKIVRCVAAPAITVSFTAGWLVVDYGSADRYMRAWPASEVRDVKIHKERPNVRLSSEEPF